MRAPSYLSVTPYGSSPSIAGSPAFNTNIFQSTHSPSLPTKTPQEIAAHIQNYQRRQQELLASTQRRIQLEAHTARRQGRDLTTGYNPLQPTSHSQTLSHSQALSSQALSSPAISHSQTLDSYHPPTSLAVNYVPPSDVGMSHSDFRENLSAQSYSGLSLNDTPHTDPYRYFQDTSAINQSALNQFTYASSISNPIYRPPTQRIPSLPATSPPTQLSYGHTETQEEEPLPKANLPTGRTQPESSPPNPTQEEATQDSKPQEKEDIPQNPTDPDLTHDDLTSEIFSGFERVGVESFDAADNEWLYSLDTPCARPGAVCECGPTCCCPGCFTHTNNPGDKGVYNTMLNKLGGILSATNEEEAGNGKSCHSRNSTSGEVKL